MSEEIKVPKGERTLVQYTKPERWLKFFGMFIAGMLSIFGYQKIPTIAEGVQISESVKVVKNLNPDEIVALQAVQVASLEKQVNSKLDAQIAAITDLKIELRSLLRDYDDRTTKQLDKHGELILNNIKSIARLEALVSKANAATQ